MRITEPMTLATDYLLGVVALVFAVRLYQQGAAAGQWSVRLWAAAFLMTATAAFVGGSYHGFVTMLAPDAGRALWHATLIATGVGSAALLAAAATAGTSGLVRQMLLLVVVVKLAAYLWWMSSHTDFIFVIADYGSALAGVMVLVWLARTSGLAPASAWIAAGVGISVLAAGVQAFRLAPHPSFNHNDLFHVIQTVAVYFLFRGGLVMRDMIRPPLQ